MLRRDFFTTVAGVLGWLGLGKAVSLTKPLESVGLDYKTETIGYELEPTEFESSETYTPKRNLAYGGAFQADTAELLFLYKGDLLGRGRAKAGSFTYQRQIVEHPCGYVAGRPSGSIQLSELTILADEWAAVAKVFGHVCNARDLEIWCKLPNGVEYRIRLCVLTSVGKTVDTTVDEPGLVVPWPAKLVHAVHFIFAGLSYDATEDILARRTSASNTQSCC